VPQINIGGDFRMAVQDQELEQKPRSLRVRVVDNSKEGHPAVNINMPIRVVKFGMKMAKTFAPQMKDANLDWDAITAMIEEGERGKIVDVEDEAEHKTIEVWVE
jgi:hypothetical protein